jgi:hypothetical protein
MTRHLLYLGLLLRVMVAFWNAYFGPSFGAEGDAADFHAVAVEFSRDLHMDRFVFGILYSYVLGTIYYFTVPSLFLGGLLSVFAWFLSARVLVRLMRLLQLERRPQSVVMFVYALLPSSILWTSVTMREPYQLLFVNLAVYCSLRIYMTRSRRHWAGLVPAVIAGGLLQPGLFAWGVVILAGTAFWLLLRKKRGIPIAKLLWVAPVAILIVSYGYATFLDAISLRFDQGLIRAIEGYQQGGLSIPARTHYKESVAIDGVTGLLVFVPTALLQYLFEPMPWRVGSLIDVQLMLENVLRGWLLWNAWRALRLLPTARRRPLWFAFLAFLTLETIFALGTVNWGTAARHHIPGMGLLIVTAFARPRRRWRRLSAPPPASRPLPMAASAA